jgi:uncharacterized protein with von Willebrand factor type A (vWA) domain
LSKKGEAGLGPEQQRALELLLEGKSVVEVAKAVGIHRGSLHRWMKHDAVFVAAYNQWHEQMRDGSHSRLMMIAERATGAVEKAIDAGDGRLALRLLEKMGVVKEREMGPTDAEEIEEQWAMEVKRKNLKRRKEASDMHIEEMGILDVS